MRIRVLFVLLVLTAADLSISGCRKLEDLRTDGGRDDLFADGHLAHGR